MDAIPTTGIGWVDAVLYVCMALGPTLGVPLVREIMAQRAFRHETRKRQDAFALDLHRVSDTQFIWKGQLEEHIPGLELELAQRREPKSSATPNSEGER